MQINAQIGWFAVSLLIVFLIGIWIGKNHPDLAIWIISKINDLLTIKNAVVIAIVMAIVIYLRITIKH